MSVRFFLDTSVFLHSFDRRVPQKAQRASQLIRRAVTERAGVVSYQVVQEFFNVAYRRFEVPLSPSDGEQYLTTVFQPLLAVDSSVALYLEAMRFRSQHQLGWYDSLIVAAAFESQCSILYSEDLQHGREFGTLKIVNPFKQP
jgi:predicted nucleic acid-binding protein